MSWLNKWQEKLLRDDRRMLNDLQLTFEGFGIEREDQKALRQSIHQLDDLFLIVVVEEFNSGKSAVINTLLGERLLEEGSQRANCSKLPHLKYDSSPV